MERKGMPLKLDGKIFGKLTVLRKAPKVFRNCNVMWECQCECGNTTQVSRWGLISGMVKSCPSCSV